MQGKVIKLVCILAVIGIVIFMVFRINSNIDYTKIYTEFYKNELSEFFEKNELNLKQEFVKEWHVLDLKNTGEPQLLILYGDHSAECVVVSYRRGKFVLGESIDLFTNVGSGGSEYKMILSRDNKIFYYSYKSKRLSYGEDSSWGLTSQIYTYENGEKVIVEELICENGKDYFLKGTSKN